MKSKKVSNLELFSSVLDLIKRGRNVKIKISGTSMEPFIKHAEDVVLSSVSFEDIKLGSVILAEYNNSYVFHRVIRKNKQHIFLVGDNNLIQIERINVHKVYAIGKELIRKHKTVNLLGLNFRIKGLVWYILRPFRRIYVKLINNKLYNYETEK